MSSVSWGLRFALRQESLCNLEPETFSFIDSERQTAGVNAMKHPNKNVFFPLYVYVLVCLKDDFLFEMMNLIRLLKGPCTVFLRAKQI